MPARTLLPVVDGPHGGIRRVAAETYYWTFDSYRAGIGGGVSPVTSNQKHHFQGPAFNSIYPFFSVILISSNNLNITFGREKIRLFCLDCFGFVLGFFADGFFSVWAYLFVLVGLVPNEC